MSEIAKTKLKIGALCLGVAGTAYGIKFALEQPALAAIALVVILCSAAGLVHLWRGIMKRAIIKQKTDQQVWKLRANIYVAHIEASGQPQEQSFRAYIAAFCTMQGLPMPPEADLADYERIIADTLNKAAGFRRAPAIAWVRMAADQTPTGKSRLGGLPILGLTPWPRSVDGTPLHHAAHIQLADLPPDHLPQGFPRTGHFAFFINANHGTPHASAIYVKDGASAPTAAPFDLPPIYGDVTGTNLFAEHAITPIALGPDTAHDNTAAGVEIATLFPTEKPQPLLPSNWRWHQMFGLGCDIQTAVADHMLDHLLFQLQTEKVMHPAFKNLGVHQFWISQDAIDRGDWAAITSTFECD